MIQKISNQFITLEAATQEMLEGVASFTAEQQNFKADADTWSMLEVVEHLVKIEEKYNLGFKKYDPITTNYKLPFSSRFKVPLLLFLVNRKGNKYKAPSFAVPTQSKLNLVDWRIKWKAQRSMLRATLEKFPPEKMSYSVAKHAIVGAMSMTQTLDFLLAHLKRHQRQIDKITQHPNFPKGMIND